MSDHPSDLKSHLESIVDDLKEKHHHSSSSSLSSSSDSEDEKKQKMDDSKHEIDDKNEIGDKVQSSVYRIFGREKPVHKVLGGGKSADIFLWRDKKISVSLAILYLRSTFINNKSPERTPKVDIPESAVLEFTHSLRVQVNQTFAYLHDIATGKDFKKFLAVIAALWIVSILGSYLNLITVFYLAFILLHTFPVLYEKYEDRADSFAEKAGIEFKKQYAVFDAKVISKLPRSLSQIKKFT